MSRFSKESSVIPKIARVIAVLVYFLVGGMFWAIFTFGHDAGMQAMPLVGKSALIALAGVPIAIYALLIGYVNGDAKRRGMRYVMWTLLAIFIPNAIGIIVYFILREPVMKPCPNCSQIVKPGFAFCPNCGYNLAPACPNCRRAVEPGWRNCAACGAPLGGVAGVAAPQPYTGPQTA
jgi:RNA polymerase subunit RPABC4/transcription elongation factor Spt4